MRKKEAVVKGGATLWARQTIESEIFYWKPDKWFKVWFYVVNRVNHKKTRLFGRGECFINYKEIMKKVKATRGEVDHCIRYLKSATMIATRKTTRGMVLKVLNYNKYQTLDNYYSDIKSDTIGEIGAIQKRHRSDTINKNVRKNDKNDKKILPKGSMPYGNPLINKFLKYLEANAEVIDTPKNHQRKDSWILIQKMKALARKKKGGEPTDIEVWNGLKFLVDTANADKFHNQRSGNIQYLYRNIGAIVKSKQTKKWTII